MDVTPSNSMFNVMDKLTDACCGKKPSALDHSTAANNIRAKRRHMMDVLHGLVSASMREGVNRAIREAQARKAGIVPADMADLNAVDQATDDAQAGVGGRVLKH